ncbi:MULTISPECIES: radical SAM family heme chaperone HemW [Bacillaceae]|uniref:radical SAM family heme chaperone HemW n=1 Tax=Bacillaceae TaxID=186817 RepID=UPI001E562930|nr:MULTISPECIES: radical SAM family heme chaperone HemW [Bacillaceae]MCE4046987.1 radical SAM family heme chaperone HemW [Bacillus sp. Au-Bac7]MCM3030091.1 radical SAM family heme chaperone HemW [Niallia sp. MER 6]MDL0436540.1 radical SAM family heme chaperone HemW [Niallia sp. SS-2023]UPO86625.1 radical SAM family heme chaperone HemW [Niallia sp. Man26]
MIKAAYIHIPFCEHICHYCDFNKVFLKGQPVDEYLDALEQEIKLTASKNNAPLKTVFVGGGTPTSLNAKQLERLCAIISENLHLAENAEYTFEANPGDLSPDKLKALYEGGVNRLSFGVQSFNDDLLQRIGRTHRAKDVFTSVEAAKKIGFDNISIDLMYSLPGQTLDDFAATLKQAFTLDIQHFSGYSLIIEPKTVFYNLLRKGKLLTPGEDAEASMYRLLMEEMAQHGYKQYEISNFAKEGYESIHNITYWNNEEYYGFGAGAHGYVNGYRRSNFGPLKKYMEPLAAGSLPLLDNHQVTLAEMMEEELFLGLRKNSGVSLAVFKEKYKQDIETLFAAELEKLLERGLISIEDGNLKLTYNGRFLGNEVFQSFIGIL